MLKMIYILMLRFMLAQSPSQITKLYKLQELTGKQIIAVMNFPLKQTADFIFECLVLGVVLDSKEIVLLQPERIVEDGKRIL